MSKRVAIIGAGISAAACAKRLQEAGMSLEIFEKARGIGGRMSYRRLENGDVYDHGAQFFTAKAEEFSKVVRALEDQGRVKQWSESIFWKDFVQNNIMPASSTRRYFCTQGMNKLAKELFGSVKINFKTEIKQIFETIHGWKLTDQNNQDYADFQTLIITAPPKQTKNLLQGTDFLAAFQEDLQLAELAPCWAVLAKLKFKNKESFSQFKQRTHQAAAMFCHDHKVLSWWADNAFKYPQHNSDSLALYLTLHANANWSKQNIEADSVWIKQQLIEAFKSSSGINEEDVQLEYSHAHRWRYASEANSLRKDFLALSSEDSRLGICGDWCPDARVESAYLSGLKLAEYFIEQA